MQCSLQHAQPDSLPRGLRDPQAACVPVAMLSTSPSSQPCKLLPANQQPVQAGGVHRDVSTAAPQPLPSILNPLKWDKGSVGLPQTPLGGLTVVRTVPTSDQGTAHVHSEPPHDEGGPSNCADSSCSTSSQHSDGLGFLPGVPMFLSAFKEDLSSHAHFEGSSALEAVSYTHLTLPTNREV